MVVRLLPESQVSIPAIFKAASIIFSSGAKSSAHSRVLWVVRCRSRNALADCIRIGNYRPTADVGPRLHAGIHMSAPHQTADLLLLLPEGPRLMRCADQLRRNRSKLVLASCCVALPFTAVLDRRDATCRLECAAEREFRPIANARRDFTKA